MMNGVASMRKIALAMDIGGSLMKVAYAERINESDENKNFVGDAKPFNQFFQELTTISMYNRTTGVFESSYFQNDKIRLHFFLLNKHRSTFDSFVDSLISHSENIFEPNRNIIAVTGSTGSFFKTTYARLLQTKGIEIQIIQLEFFASFGGLWILNDLCKQKNPEIYRLEKSTSNESSEDFYKGFKKSYVTEIDSSFIFVCIGTGTSLMHITKDKCTYLLHSNISGATYLGLCKIMANCNTFNEAIQASELGEGHKSTDYTMRDLIGNSKEAFDEIADTMKQQSVTESGLNEGPEIDFIINSFGKCAINETDANQINRNDLANSALMMVINSCVLSSYHEAKTHNCKQIVFGGSFLSNNFFGKYQTAKLVRYLSNATIEALFLENDAFINTIGCFYDSQKHPIEFGSLM